MKLELEIRKHELEEQLFYNSLERIFIEDRIYKERKFETAKDIDEVVSFVDSNSSHIRRRLSVR